MSTKNFLHEGLPARILFGSGMITRISDEVRMLGVERPLVLCTPGRADQGGLIQQMLGESCVGIFSGARMHTPADVTVDAARFAAEVAADGLVAIGGGSTTGLSKAIALRTDLPQIVIPTTYAGSEVTPILGETKGGLKTTQRSMRVLPETVIYDVDLTLDLPLRTTVASGLNAMAHAAEALYAESASPLIMLTAEEGVRALVDALPRIIAEPSSKSAREQALYGAWICGVCLGAVGMALHHKLCHALGGSLDLPHAETHSVILPHALAYNLSAAPEARRRLRRATGWEDPAVGLHAFAKRLGAATSLSSLGMQEEDIERMADVAIANPYRNPRPLEREGIRNLLERAWRGEAPEAD